MLAAAIALIGFTAVMAQTIFLREFLVVFQGNEIIIALALAAWLAWTALGSTLGGRAQPRSPLERLICLEILSGLALPLTVFAVRSIRAVCGALPGEALPPWLALVAALAALNLFCAMSGALFAAAAQALGAAAPGHAGGAAGRVYLLEALGALAGGLATGLILVARCDSMEIALLGAGSNLIMAAVLLSRSGRVKSAVALGLLVVLLAAAAPGLTRKSLGLLWRGWTLEAYLNSPYANLVVVGQAGNRTLYENGLVAASQANAAEAEESVHFALLQHPEPRSLLLVGGALGGGIAEALKHPSLERIDCVELDPALFGIWSRYFGLEPTAGVHLHTADARLWLKTCRRRFDVIIVNLPDPQTAQLNRFYTLEFFREAARRLAPGGVFSFRLTGGENYISPQRGAFLRCINQTLRRAFLQVAAYPGATVHFFASNRRAPLVTDPQQLALRLKSRRIEAQYVNPFDLPFRLAEDRRLQLELAIRPQPATPVNRDFAPVAYYFNSVLWSAQFRGRTNTWLEAFSGIPWMAVAVAAFFSMAALALLGSRRPAPARSLACISVAAMGFTMMALELLLLLGYQALYGVVYKEIAMVTGAFMGGMAAGSWRGLKSRMPARVLAALGWMAAGSAVALTGVMAALAGAQGSAAVFAGRHLLFPLLAALAGMLGGWQFPAACRVYLAGGGAPGLAGKLYAWDLVGACAGALTIGAWLIPAYGFLNTALLISVVNLPPAALACRPAPHAPVTQ